MTINFTIYGLPIAKGRPKFSTYGGFARAYTPKKTRDHEESIAIQAAKFRPEKLLSGALKLTIMFYMPILKSFSKKKRLLAISNDIFPVKKPELDNLAKVKDALNKIIWEDDSLIIEEHLYKHYSETPKTVITIEEIF